jgi:hypothetical protein
MSTYAGFAQHRHYIVARRPHKEDGLARCKVANAAAGEEGSPFINAEPAEQCIRQGADDRLP